MQPASAVQPTPARYGRKKVTTTVIGKIALTLVLLYVCLLPFRTLLLGWGVEYDNLALMRISFLLLADPNADMYEGDRPLHGCDGNEGVVSTLLAAGADINAINERRQTPLIVASYDGDLGLIKALIRHKAKLNVRDTGDHTALWYAEYYKFSEIARLLRDAGATH